jgi:hypothetical protein
MLETDPYPRRDEERDRGIFIAMKQVPKAEWAATRQGIEGLVYAYLRNDRHALRVLVYAARCGRLDEYTTKLEQHLGQNPGETDIFLATCYMELGIRPKITPADRPEPTYWRAYTAFCDTVCRDRRDNLPKETLS